MPPHLLLLDGGLGTTLEQHHALPLSSPLWSTQPLLSPTTRPSLINCHRSFILSGAAIILTATYQLPPSAPAALACDAIAAADEARADTPDPKPDIALSLGPYGATMTPSTEYSAAYDPSHRTVASLAAWHAARLRLFEPLPSAVGLLAFETIPRVEEITAVRAAVASSAKPDVEFWISCVFPGDGGTLPDGTAVEEAVDAMLRGEGARPWGVGINCCAASKVRGLVGRYRAAVEGVVARGEGGGWPWLVVYPDGTRGEVYNTVTKRWEGGVEGVGGPLWEEEVAGVVVEEMEKGGWKGIVVGGCCRTDSHDIGRLRGALAEKGVYGGFRSQV
ncbi:Homocysteine S-methyltransferase [Podospora conica]|nr:Homocysteine S-methyltransferase [Schizothecium conicum]